MKLPPGSVWRPSTLVLLLLASRSSAPAAGTASPCGGRERGIRARRAGRGLQGRARSCMQMSGREVSGSWKREQTEWPPRLPLRAPRSAGAPAARRSAGASAASSTLGGTGLCTVWVRKAGLTPAREGGRGLSIGTDPAAAAVILRNRAEEGRRPFPI